MRRCLFIYGVLVCCCIPAIHGQATYKVTRYTSREGLPQNSVRGLTFDHDGFLWLATDGGIARFDGNYFELVGLESFPELEGQRFSRLAMLPDSSLNFSDPYWNQFILKGNRLTKYPSAPEMEDAFSSDGFPAGVAAFEVLKKQNLQYY